MTDITVKVIEAATSADLMTLDELKVALGIESTDTSEDAQLTQWIEHYSDVIATMCNRVFAKEKVEETWRGDEWPYGVARGRIFLTHYPVAKDEDIEIVSAPDGATIDPANYEIENRSGKLQFFTGWSEPIRVTYTGGYALPDEAPPALKQALTMFITAARVAQTRAETAGIRSMTHKEARVQFFDPNSGQSKGSGGSVLGEVGNAVSALLTHYIRLYV